MNSSEAYEFSHVPENYIQPGIFELIKEGTLRKMGKLSKEAIIQKALKNSKYVRDCDIPIPEYDPTANDPMPEPPALPADSMSNGTDTLVCAQGQEFCRLGCVCVSINCDDMYDDHYEKHCRDTGDPKCMFGCVCNNGPGPKSNGESRWVISKPYKYKRPRVRDDEDCGFIPLHLREMKGENGRPKRRAQPPTRYRPDLSKQERLLENGKLELNGVKASTRPRRRLCEEEASDASDDSDDKIYTKTRSKDSENNKLNISRAVEKFEDQLGREQKWARLQAARKAKAAYATGSLPRGRPPKKGREVKSETVSLDASEDSDSRASGNQTDTYVPAKRGRKPGSKNGCTSKSQSAERKSGRKKVSESADKVVEDVKPPLERLRDPSKRVRKPRCWDLEPEPQPKRPYNRKSATNNGHFTAKSGSSGAVQIKQESKPKQITKPKEHKTLTVSTFLHVIQIQLASKTCQGMYAVLRSTSAIITFVSWDSDCNVIPHLQEMQFRFTGSTQNTTYDKTCDLVLLPYIPSQDTVWFFYALKRNYLSWTLVMFPEIHAIFSTEVLCKKIRDCQKKAHSKSQFIDVSHLNVNAPATNDQHLYLFLGKEGDIFLCGTPPDVFMDRNPSRQAELRQNALVRLRSESFFRTKPLLPPTKTYAKTSTKAKIQTSTTPIPPPPPLVPAPTFVAAAATEPTTSLPMQEYLADDFEAVGGATVQNDIENEKTLPEDDATTNVASADVYEEDKDKTEVEVEPETSDILLLTSTAQAFEAPITSAYEISTGQACDYTITPAYDFSATEICEYSAAPTCNYSANQISDFTTAPGYEFSNAPAYQYTTIPACDYEMTQSYEIPAPMITLDMEVEPTA